jgi:AcrR family transcriptional regulator
VNRSSTSKRRYNSTRRQAQAKETRTQVIKAANRLFSLQGYSGTTIDSIAQEAGVSSETIYSVFGNKRNILANLIDVSVGGDNLPIPLLQRSGPQAVLHDNDPKRLLSLFAEDIATILERVAPIIEITRFAAKAEPEIADVLKKILDQRMKNLGAITQHLIALGSLRDGLDAEQATEIIWVITSPEVFILLLRDRGWNKEYYVRWLSDTLNRLLLPLSS